MKTTRITAYVLAKNEAENIGKCLDRLVEFSIPTVVLDSGSVDDTVNIAKTKPFVRVEPYRYTTHVDAYNWITETRTSGTDWALVLDADMEITRALWLEIRALVDKENIDALLAPIQMYSEGVPLGYGSLCPAKPIAFKGGKKMFEARGHTEAILPSIKSCRCESQLIHNDHKPYYQYLCSQLRYAEVLLKRSSQGQLNWRDRIRLFSPLLAVLVPMYSYFFKAGFRSGKAGIVYAVDRMIAELLQFRQATVARIKKENELAGNTTITIARRA